MREIKLALLFLLLVALVLVVLQNTSVVSFRFLLWNVSMSRILLFLILFISGFAAGYLVAKMPKS